MKQYYGRAAMITIAILFLSAICGCRTITHVYPFQDSAVEKFTASDPYIEYWSTSKLQSTNFILHEIDGLPIHIEEFSRDGWYRVRAHAPAGTHDLTLSFRCAIKLFPPSGYVTIGKTPQFDCSSERTTVQINMRKGYFYELSHDFDARKLKKTTLHSDSFSNTTHFGPCIYNCTITEYDVPTRKKTSVVATVTLSHPGFTNTWKKTGGIH